MVKKVTVETCSILSLYTLLYTLLEHTCVVLFIIIIQSILLA